jgi:hypothetical protein
MRHRYPFGFRSTEIVADPSFGEVVKAVGRNDLDGDSAIVVLSTREEPVNVEAGEVRDFGVVSAFVLPASRVRAGKERAEFRKLKATALVECGTERLFGHVFVLDEALATWFAEDNAVFAREMKLAEAARHLASWGFTEIAISARARECEEEAWGQGDGPVRVCVARGLDGPALVAALAMETCCQVLALDGKEQQEAAEAMRVWLDRAMSFS